MEDISTSEAPCVDFSLQFSFAKRDEYVETRIFNVLEEIATDVMDGKRDNLGAIVVLGDFTGRSSIPGLVQMKPKQNPIDDLIMVDDDSFIDIVIKFSEQPYDGAIVVDKTGQVIGAGIYLVVDDPTLNVPEGCGTRHKAAASFSLRNDAVSVLTLSEETNTIRIWKDGKQATVQKIKAKEIAHEQDGV